MSIITLSPFWSLRRILPYFSCIQRKTARKLRPPPPTPQQQNRCQTRSCGSVRSGVGSSVQLRIVFITDCEHSIMDASVTMSSLLGRGCCRAFISRVWLPRALHPLCVFRQSQSGGYKYLLQVRSEWTRQVREIFDPSDVLAHGREKRKKRDCSQDWTESMD